MVGGGIVPGDPKRVTRCYSAATLPVKTASIPR